MDEKRSKRSTRSSTICGMHGRGKEDEVAGKAQEVEQKLTELHRDGEITDADRNGLRPAVNRLTAVLPSCDDD